MYLEEKYYFTYIAYRLIKIYTQIWEKRKKKPQQGMTPHAHNPNPLGG